MKKQRHGNFLDDCWEIIVQELREDDQRNLGPISLVSKRFLSISNRMKLNLNVNNETLPLLPNLLRRFRHIKTIVIHTDPGKDIDRFVYQISRSGLLNLEAIKFLCCSTKTPRDGFKALALNENIKNSLKVLDCSGLFSMQDDDLVLIAELFPRLEELKIRAYRKTKNDDFTASITDDGVDAIASKLKYLKEIVLTGTNACFITDQSLISLSKNCVKLTSISLDISRSGLLCLTGEGIDFVMRHSPNLTDLSLNMWSLEPSAPSCKIEKSYAIAKNLHSLTLSQYFFSDKHIRLIAEARPPLKKLKLVGSGGQDFEIQGALKLVLQACQLEELALGSWFVADTGISDLAQHLSNLTSIDLHECFGLTSVTFYTLVKSCPLLETLKMTHTEGQEMGPFSPEFVHKNYHMQHLDISGNMWLTDFMLKKFGQACPNLQFLDVSRCMCLTDFGIGRVLKACPAITQLNMNHLMLLGVFGKYFDLYIENLKTVKARWSQINDDAMGIIGSRCRNLQHLDIGFCKNVTHEGVMEVVRNCERLRYITLIGCNKVSSDILPQMVLSRPSLRNIDPPGFGVLSEQTTNTVLSFGCRLGVCP